MNEADLKAEIALIRLRFEGIHALAVKIEGAVRDGDLAVADTLMDQLLVMVSFVTPANPRTQFALAA